MEDLLSMIFVFLTLASVFGKAAKKKQPNKQKQQTPGNVFTGMGAPEAVTRQPSAAPPVTMMPPRPESKPAAAQISIDDYMARSSAGHGSMEGRTDHSAHISCEGHDPCHEEQLRPAVRPSRVAPAAVGATIAFKEEDPALRLNFTGDELVRAFVMQEVLTRPCERTRRIGCR